MRRPLAALLVAVTVLTSAAPATARPEAAAVASPHRYLDARGDTRYGRTDVLRVTVDNGPRIKVTVRMGDAIPFRSWGTRISSITIPFNTKAAMFISSGESSFGLGGPTIICPVRRQYLADQESYVFSMNRECRRDPARVHVFVQAGASTGETDRAPNNSWSPWVKKRS